MKNYNIINVIIILILSCCVIVSMQRFYTYNDKIEVSFEHDTDTESKIKYRVWWTTEKNDKVHRDKVVTKYVGGNEKTVTLKLPVEKVSRFRIGANCADKTYVTIKNLRISGDKEIIFHDLKEFQRHIPDTKYFQLKNQLISFYTDPLTPWLEWKEDLGIQANIKINFYFLFIILFLVTMGAFWCIRVLNSSSHKLCNVYFVLLYLCVSALPWIDVNTESVSKAENRKLAPFPQFFAENGNLNVSFGKQFEAWFQDRFTFRDLLIKGYGYFVEILGGKKENSSSIKFDNNWCYSKRYTDEYLHGYDSSKIPQLLSNVERLNNWCKQNNIKLYFVFIPTKIVVYPENNKYIKELFTPQNYNVRDFAKDIKKRCPDVSVVYTLNDMLRSKMEAADELLFYKADSHISEDGAYIVYKSTMTAIRRDYPEIPIIDKLGNHIKRQKVNFILRAEPELVGNVKDGKILFGKGDLGGPLHLNDTDYDVEYNHYTPDSSLIVSERKGVESMQTLYKSQIGKKRAVLIGDSTSSYTRHWFRYSFAELYRIRWNNSVAPNQFKMARYEKTILSFNPDILIVQIFEPRAYVHMTHLY